MVLRNIKNLKGKKFGKLIVLKRGPNYPNTSRTRWYVMCDCGNRKLVYGNSLSMGRTKSCGCRLGRAIKHGHCVGGKPSSEYNLWIHAKQRSIDHNIKFNIEVDDIIIPKTCPVFNIELVRHSGSSCGPNDNSPTLDKIIPSLGYTKGNVWVISSRANRAKSNLSLSELELLVEALRKRIKNG